MYFGRCLHSHEKKKASSLSVIWYPKMMNFLFNLAWVLRWMSFLPQPPAFIWAWDLLGTVLPRVYLFNEKTRKYTVILFFNIPNNAGDRKTCSLEGNKLWLLLKVSASLTDNAVSDCW